MNTLKSAALMIVLLGVLYGVYVALNKPEPAGASLAPSDDAVPPLVDSGTTESVVYPPSSAPPPLARGPNDSPAPRPVRGGSFQPSLDAGSVRPPTKPAAGTRPDPSTANAAAGVQRSAYESLVTSPAVESSAAGSSSQPPPLEAISPAASAARDAAPALAAYALRRDLAEAEQLVAAGKLKSALARLTPHYASSDLPSDQRALVFSWLDALAAKVIYSREHLLSSPHQVRKGETLYDIAHQYNVEYRLLHSINEREVSDPLVLVPATELKVVPGPFRADVNLTSGEVTLLVGDLYAGRFAFTLGDQPPQPGDYKVVDKRSQQKTYVGFDGRVIPANDPGNPYGGWWISLGGEVAIHGSPESPARQTLGCISLSPQDAKDIYGILSIGSDVKIRR